MRAVVILGLILLALPSRADPIAGDILKRPLAPYGTGYLSGLTDEIRQVNAKDGHGPLYCQQPSLNIMPAQHREILRRKVEANQALAREPASYVMALGLIDTFRCPAKL